MGVGVVDGLSVLAASSLPTSAGRGLVLVATDAAALAMVGLVAALPLALFGRRLRRVPALDAWAGLWLGVVVTVLAGHGLDWFTAPPPFTESPPGHGSPVIFGVEVVAAAGLWWLVARVTGAPLRRLMALGLCLAGLVQVGLHVRHLPASGVAAASAPNVLLVSLDTTRADGFGVHGASGDPTPVFDRLAREGLWAREAMAPIPVTGPSHATLLSGRGPWSHGNLLNGLPLPAELPLLPERLRAEGYRTGGFVSAYVLEGDLGFSRGFEVYDDDFDWLQGWSDTVPGGLLAGLARLRDPHLVLERRGGRTTDHALAWLEGLPAQSPWFAWVHLFDAHGPYEPPPPWDTAFYDGDPRDPGHTSMAEVDGVAAYLAPSLEGITDADWVRSQYQGEVAYADQQLGRLVSWLEETGQAADTLVVVVGDHGESLGEHGVWFNHGDDLFEPASHVPLVLWRPGAIAAATVDSPVEVGDLSRTMLTHLGFDPLPGDGGQDLVAVGEGVTPRPFARAIAFDRAANLAGRRAGLITRPTWRMVALRGPGTRYVLSDAEEGGGASFYDLRVDPTETTEQPLDRDLGLLLRDQARSLLSEMSADDMARSATELDPETRKRLEQLGYLDG